MADSCFIFSIKPEKQKWDLNSPESCGSSMTLNSQRELNLSNFFFLSKFLMLIQPVCNSIAERKMYLKYCLVLDKCVKRGLSLFLDNYCIMNSAKNPQRFKSTWKNQIMMLERMQTRDIIIGGVDK